MHPERIHFGLYGDTCPTQNMALSDLLMEPDLCARVETSGSEGFYVEVARWSYKRKRYERFAFLKCLGGELGDDLNGCETACAILEHMQNTQCDRWEPIVHTLPSWQW